MLFLNGVQVIKKLRIVQFPVGLCSCRFPSLFVGMFFPVHSYGFGKS